MPRILVLIVLSLLVACRRAPPPEAHKTVALPAPAPTEAPKAVPAPEAPTATAAPTPERKPMLSVAMYISSGSKSGFGMPTAGQASTIRVTPINEKGQPVRELGSVLGAQLVLVALRADLTWLTLQRAPELSDKAHNSHEFKVTFASGGSHVLYFLFREKDQQVAAVPVFIQVDGKTPEPTLPPERSLRYVGKDGVSATLQTPEEPFAVCAPATVTSTWLRHGKALALAQGTAAVHYVAIDAGLGGVSVAREEEDGTHATFTFDKPGQYRVLALAEPAGKKADAVLAQFAFSVTGKAAEHGCAATAPAAAPSAR